MSSVIASTKNALTSPTAACFQKLTFGFNTGHHATHAMAKANVGAVDPTIGDEMFMNLLIRAMTVRAKTNRKGPNRKCETDRGAVSG
jgi:hypothetical protein